MLAIHDSRKLLGAVLPLGLAACGESDSNDQASSRPVSTSPSATTPATAPAVPASMSIKLVALNDLHGNLEPSKTSITAPSSSGGTVAVPAGGAAYMASAIASLKARNVNNAVVSAGDMIGASPVVSALFLDEPTIEAVDVMKIDFNAAGHHEFDKGQTELLRMKNGGCAKNTALEPCKVNKAFPGADFGFLAANTVKADGTTLFPSTGFKTFSQGGATAKVAFIGMTLEGTPNIVTPAGVAGLTFEDEVDTANALIPGLRAQGADVIVVVVHEGGMTTVGYNDRSCAGLSGDLLPILNPLDANVDVAVSGHAHRACVCDYAKTHASQPFLLTSAGQYGTLVTDINLTVDTSTLEVTARSADNVIVQGEACVGETTTVALTSQYPQFERNTDIANLIAQYLTVAQPLVVRVTGRLSAPATRTTSPSRESAMGNLIADARLAATAPVAKGGARIAFMNPGGVRADLVPAANGDVTYGQLFSVQPFGSSLVVKTMAGAQIFTFFNQGTDVPGGDQDIDALESCIKASGSLAPPSTSRISTVAAT